MANGRRVLDEATNVASQRLILRLHLVLPLSVSLSSIHIATVSYTALLSSTTVATTSSAASSL
ncbi:hypothetical protein RO3G_01389 [Rhizopus delemar RA 99-880]|uniref:Uncharacterized protein n=1 Tax=Rhizopus delemar (strain RA 99-880 / ATCC MYA-4621 / FGSC 9543 / NRRL 43880) TaxID=246409 RepID=I1BKF5_RHIO9|nr:hypothetical protein RO3G_01389 [Rhizopus delemar RA 99-880]|eukprot:EIE76685.1 hypothetical protein RO3G_01389 [Rhizopus delemar RA 99-880]